MVRCEKGFPHRRKQYHDREGADSDRCFRPGGVARTRSDVLLWLDGGRMAFGTPRARAAMF